ncbi:transaldolase family protein [Streptomyces sp. AM 4-1-1]|uniref:transaldolase family protein n=1 Tax=Streptomyces sp. AM 4-1-1 TaxID=3028710 RepID=UPI0023B98F1E|nr:transaldolase family protein [Streptomyces sp. AM 4-1-1]WEH34596.1 transaldolase family protein [Streptomyces sp. AM 4-1-1]
MRGTVKRLINEGVAVWLDGIGRGRPAGSGLQRLIADHGVTGARFDPAAVWDPYDLQDACDALRPAHLRTARRDGLVSVPLGPWPAGDARQLLTQARALRHEVRRPNLLVQIPATTEALPVLTDCLAEGIGVDATLIFSTQRYGQVVEAFMRGLERAAGAGHDLGVLASTASFPLVPLDAEVDAWLEKAGTDESKALRGRAAVATARLVHQAHEELFSSARWGRLAAAGASTQRLLWLPGGPVVATGDPVRRVEELVTRGTATALTEVTLRAVAERGVVAGDRVLRHYADAARTLDYLGWFGVSSTEVAGRLEEAGLNALVASQVDRAVAELGDRDNAPSARKHT